MIAQIEPERAGFQSRLRSEAEEVLKDPSFKRSPSLAKLLRYLVEETAAGRSESLKSFVVAVDALGRSGDFDPALDSSARVQMARLRKALESYYAQHGPLDELCLYLLPGSYTVRMGKLSVAYPMLYRPLSDIPGKPPAVPAETTPAPSEPATNAEAATSRLPFYRRNPVISACTLLGIIAGILMVLFWQQLFRSVSPQYSPVLELMPVDSGGRPELQPTARLVATTFASDLPRFRLSRLRVIENRDARPQPSDGEKNAYRLFSRVVDNGDAGEALYLNIDDSRSDTTLWSKKIDLPADRKAKIETLTPLIAEINGPMGVLVANETVATRDRNDGGYPCLIKYFQFVRTRQPASEDKVAACFKKPVKERRMEATLLAARAMFAIERRSARGNFEKAARDAVAFARAAVAADPNDGSANFALARLSYMTGDCVSARFYTRRTMETNPLSPMFTATLAGLGEICDYPDAENLLDQAFLTQTPLFVKGRLLLVLGALGQNRPEKIDEIAPTELPQSRYNRINYYLAESLIAASRGQRAQSRRYWQLFSKTIPPGSKTPEDKLAPIVAIPAMRRKIVAYLRNAGAFQT